MANTVFYFIVVLVFSYAQTSLSRDSGSKIPLIENAFPVIPPPQCIPPDYDSFKKIKVKVLTEQSMALTEESRLKIYLYGYNKWGADAPATLLRAYSEKISTMPSDFEFQFPNEDYKKIKYIPVECPNEAGYYLVVYIDVNGDNKFCDGDFYQDYDKEEFNSFYGDNLANIMEFQIPMRSQIDGNCSDF